MADNGIDVSGLDDLGARLVALGVQINEEAGNALRAEAELIMTRAKELTPVLTGVLRASGNVTGPIEGANGEQEVKLAFGGAASGYAIYVHENLEAHHDVGQAKFLEQPVLAAVATLPERIAARIARSVD